MLSSKRRQHNTYIFQIIIFSMNRSPFKTILYIFAVGLIIFFAPIIFFALYFKSQTLSHDPVDWANFSNYLSGLLTPFFTLINLLALIYLTFEIAKRNKNQHNEAIEHQKKIHFEQLSNQKLIQLKDLKYSAFKDFIKLSADINKSIVDFDQPGLKLSLYRLEFVGLIQLNRKMFPSLNVSEKTNKISTQIADLSAVITQVFKNNEIRSVYSELQGKMKKLIEDFHLLLSDMQKELE